MKGKATKRALVSSIISIVLCVTMLIGTTFAWFTDTASTAVNKIQAGTLLVDIVDANGNTLEGKELTFVKDEDALDGEEVLWEPGVTYKTGEFYIKNEGNLALKYKVMVSGVSGNTKLLEAIEFTVQKGDADAVALEGWEGVLLPEGETSDALDVEKTKPITIIGHMKESAGNEYQDLAIEGIAITVVASQYTYEYDSIGNTYDENAAYLNTDAEGNIIISNAAELHYLAATSSEEYRNPYDGKTVILTNDIDLAGVEWSPIIARGMTFDGQSHTISNFQVNGTKNLGLFGELHACTIKNLNVTNATVIGVGRVGAIVGQGLGDTVIEGCTVKNSTVTAATWWDPAEKSGQGYWNDGDKVGALIGHFSALNSTLKITNCSVEGCTITGYRDIGGLAGCGSYEATVSGNTVKTTKIVQNLINGYKTITPTTVGEIVGRFDASFTLDTTTNTATEVTLSQITE